MLPQNMHDLMFVLFSASLAKPHLRLLKPGKAQKSVAPCASFCNGRRPVPVCASDLCCDTTRAAAHETPAAAAVAAAAAAAAEEAHVPQSIFNTTKARQQMLALDQSSKCCVQLPLAMALT
jgi:hypothetical protein